MKALANDLLYALDSEIFAKSLGFIPDQWQVKVLRSDCRRLLLNCSRQSGKSTTASIIAVHRANYYDNSLVLLLSPSQRQSSELFKKVNDFIIKLNIKPKLLEDNKLSCTFRNKSRIVSLPSTEQTIRGFSGASLIIEDEASRVPDELYRAVRPMLAVSRGKLILMSTPFGKRGHFYEEWENGIGWERVRVPATECPRISADFLEEERNSLGDWWFKQEYMCEFVETVDQIFSHEYISNALSDEVQPLF